MPPVGENKPKNKDSIGHKLENYYGVSPYNVAVIDMINPNLSITLRNLIVIRIIFLQNIFHYGIRYPIILCNKNLLYTSYTKTAKPNTRSFKKLKSLETQIDLDLPPSVSFGFDCTFVSLAFRLPIVWSGLDTRGASSIVIISMISHTLVCKQI